MVSSISRSIPAPPPRPTAPDYHHYVTSLLHRRWVRVCTLVFWVCFVETWLVTNKRGRIVWSLLSAVPAKTALLWVAMLPVLVMRVQLVHLGTSVRSSAARDFQRLVGSFKTYATGLSYMFSAFVFVVIYMYTSEDRDHLWIVVEPNHERSRLNERYLYLIFLSIWIGVIHTIVHLASDRDRVELPAVTIELRKDKEELALQAAKKRDELRELCIKQGNLVLRKAFRQSVITTLTGMFAYLPFRYMMWRYTFRVTRIFYRISNTPEPYNWPVGFMFYTRTFWITFLIFSLWEITQSAFQIYFSMEPLKDGRILSDLSADPNGTLVTGFMHTSKPFTQACAFWELVYITFNKPDRRRSIFVDIDRPVKIFDEIVFHCLAVLEKAKLSIELKDHPVTHAPPPSPISFTELASPSVRAPIPPIWEGKDIFKYPYQKMPESVRQWQATDGSLLGDKVSAKLAPHTPDIKAAKDRMGEEFISVRKKFLESRAGKPFRQTVERKTQGLIPNVKLQIDAVAALAKLCIYAQSEDEFGVVGRRVGDILEKFFDMIDCLESYIQAPGIHWTDMESEIGDENLKARLKEPKELLDVLNLAVKEMVTAYRQYLNDLDLSVKVGKRARLALEKPVNS
ncbi:nucleoporin protein Ndc1-Nup [Terfezia claveryi]|nr:nucleoporin protein Ndc1-Nup [Terfezia claveryi]